MSDDEKRDYLRQHGWRRHDRAGGKDAAGKQVHYEYWQSPVPIKGYQTSMSLKAAYNHQQRLDQRGAEEGLTDQALEEEAAPTVVNIIDIDLGTDVHAVIADNLTAITQQNETEIAAAIADSKRLADARAAREQADQAATDVVAQAFTAIQKADDAGQTIGAADLLAIVQPHVTTMNSLVQRLKAHIKANQLPCRLQSLRQGKQSYYYLGPPDSQHNGDQ